MGQVFSNCRNYRQGLLFVSGQVEASLLGQRLEFESNPKCRE